MFEFKPFVNSVIYSNSSSFSDSDFLENTINSAGFSGLISINGDFCGAIQKDSNWILFRDHMGVMPLFYYLKDDKFYFSEDIRELCAVDGVDLSINDKWFYLEMTGHSTLSLRETEFKYIFAVCPGTWTEFYFDNNKWQLKENFYWKPGQKKIKMSSDQEYIDELRRLIESAIKIRLDKYPGKVGAEASGGLDSSVIDLIVCKQRKDVVLASWSVPYDLLPMKEVDERQVIEDVCKAAGTTFKFIPFEDSEICDCTARFLPAYTNTVQLSKTAKMMSDEGVSVIFTGHGGDEGVSHRSNLTELWHYGEYASYVKETWLGTKGEKLRILRTIKRCTMGVTKTLPKLKKGWQNEIFDLSCCLNSDFLKSMSGVHISPLHFAYDPLQYVMNGGSRSRMDNCAIQAKDFGVRYLFPFLDYRVIDFALSIPRRLYIHDGVDRFIYREAFKDIMPKSLYDVNYKDFPSLRPSEDKNQNSEDKENERTSSEEDKADQLKRQHEWMELQLGQLDWDRWNKYFDKSLCEKLLMSDFRSLSDDEITRIRMFTSKLYSCSLIQNLQDNAKEWKKQQSDKV